MFVSDSALSSLPVSHTVAGTSQDDVEVHPVNPDAGVILDAEVNVLLDAKPKVALIREVLLTQLVLFDL